MEKLEHTPLEHSVADERGYELFREDLIWHNGEVCNACFSYIRNIGPKIWKAIDSQTLWLNQWYERTDNGTQEHTIWDNNKRFGTCYCLNCGTDAKGNHRHKTTEELKPLAARIWHYIEHQTEHDLDQATFGREIREMKKVPEYQGYETEIVGLAFSRAFRENRQATEANKTPHPASAD